MGRLKTMAELEKLQAEILKKRNPETSCVTVCLGTGCQAYNSRAVYDAFVKEINTRNLTEKIHLKGTGCHGFCEQGPVVVIFPSEIFYRRVKPEDVPRIITDTVLGGKLIDELLYQDPVSGQKYSRESEIPFYRHQRRSLLGQNMLIDPGDIDDYIALGGYQNFAKALFKMTPEEVIEEVKKANLRGRGGAGFPAGVKWETTRNAPGDKKYVIVNADEGDPGAYMDRSLLEGNPHLILEGLAIGAYAIGADEGYVYVRQEYPLAVKNLSVALQQAEKYGLLGENILDRV